ncbi:HepT-like ribonuclease domain-containing protein [Aureimonas sp. Leaf324]|uniref:HepT-like ribonuclease domain-containing protein n=1 Tax=Aureimonas sp. Leaf324 TaxID=1736336 RepID=UPI0006FAD2A3|nr:HepT-like ribonuclease domain-containing protein [Aureimonas sp. Leaf324]KQQ85687.1 hypothetical protein ASF65_03825 [Aureimonas sp. Leaf324]
MRSDQARFQWSVHEALHYAERAIRYVGDQDIAELSRNSMAVDATVRCIEVIGETAVRAKKASPEIYAQHRELMFDELRDARNAAIQEYERVDPEDLSGRDEPRTPATRHT